jgi:hypothetical protein
MTLKVGLSGGGKWHSNSVWCLACSHFQRLHSIRLLTLGF